MRFHNAALNSVNSRLGDTSQGNTDGVVASVIGFACHSVSHSYAVGSIEDVLILPQRQTSNYDNWQLHMSGLQCILQVRGNRLKPISTEELTRTGRCKTRGGADSVRVYNIRLLLFLVDTAGACQSANQIQMHSARMLIGGYQALVTYDRTSLCQNIFCQR